MELLTVCVDVSKFLIPHLLLLFSIKRLENYKKDPNPGLFKLINMPDDIVGDILMRLPLKSLCRLRCVSKTCMNMVDSFTPLHTARLLKISTNDYAAAASASEVPQLVQVRYSSGTIEWQPLTYNDKLKYALPISERFIILSYFRVDFVFCDLFFLKIGRCGVWSGICSNSYRLVNPQRGEVLKIPACPTHHEPTHHESRGDWFGMGFDITTNTYKLVCVWESGAQPNYQITASVYVLGTDSSSWREIPSVPPRLLSRKNVCAYGDMHWLVEQGSHVNIAGGESHIISFDFKKEEFCWTSHPALKGLKLHGEYGLGNSDLLEDIHLLNIQGSMALVDNNSREECIHIWIMKSYLKREWALDYIINTQTLAGCPKGGLRNCTCYEWQHGIAVRKDNVCYFLRLRCDAIQFVRTGLENIYSFTGSLISLKKL